MAAAAHSHSCTSGLESAQCNQPFSSRRELEKSEVFLLAEEGRGLGSEPGWKISTFFTGVFLGFASFDGAAQLCNVTEGRGSAVK